jgi:multidrug efflux system membrane fusion protein
MKYKIRILALSFLTITFFSCSEDEKVIEKMVRPVKYEEVGFFGGEKNRTFSGISATDKTIKLSFRSTGVITKFEIKLGQKVKKGQLLAKIDNEQARLSYENAKSSMSSAKSQMNTAKLSLNRVRSLYEKGSSSLSSFEGAKNSFATAQQSYQTAERNVKIQREKMSYGSLYAPENGVIATVTSEIDENVSPGQTVATLNSGTNMQISLGLPESIINRVKPGMSVNVHFTSFKDKMFSAEVTEISPALDVNSSTYPVSVRIIDLTDEIKSGMSADVTFSFGNENTSKKELIVPAQAVGEDSEGRFVFVIEEGETTTVKKQKVVIGELTAEGFEIKSGLSSGQKIATAGLQTILDGQTVRIE